MSFFKNLFSSRKERAAERHKISALHKIQVKIDKEVFLLADYSMTGLACTLEVSKKHGHHFERGEVVNVDFLIHGYRKASASIKIMWATPEKFGAKAVDSDEFQAFARQYLQFVKEKE